MMAATFGVEVKASDDGGIVVAAWGELDIATVGAFDDCMAEAFAAPEGKVLVDLTRVDFADTMAAGSLGRAAVRAQAEKRELVLQASRPVRRILILTRTARRFTFDE